MQAMSSAGAMSHSGESSMPEMQLLMPLNLDFLAGPEGLPRNLPMLVKGLNITKVNLFDLNGTVVWSTDPQIVGKNNSGSPLYQRAAAGKIASKLSGRGTSAHLGDTGKNTETVATL